MFFAQRNKRILSFESKRNHGLKITPGLRVIKTSGRRSRLYRLGPSVFCLAFSGIALLELEAKKAGAA
jgi:hypothetical protein